MRSMRIAVYTGPGASNSWIWVADFLERFGYLNSRFFSKPSYFRDRVQADVLVIPGGDTFLIAETLGKDGLRNLSLKIAAGMGYVGICAGAYLPMRSSIAPLSDFNLSNVRAANLAPEIPRDIKDAERYTYPYGCSLVFHPARGPVLLSGESDLTAPLYGGPLMIPSDEDRMILSFGGAASDTEILIDKQRFESVISGTAACIESHYGEGRLLLISPHLEHPGFSDANELLCKLINGFDTNGYSNSELQGDSSTGTGAFMELRKFVSDLRILSNALGANSWKVGVKYWENEKLQFFSEAVRSRLKILVRNNMGGELRIPDETLSAFRESKAIMKTMTRGGSEISEIQKLIDLLSFGTSLFLNSYFELVGSKTQ